MKTIVALVLCVGLLTVLYVLFGVVEVGIYQRIVNSESFDIRDIWKMNSSEKYRISGIAGMIALIYAVFDLHSLTAKVRTNASNEPQPRNQPIQFAMVRARRYLTILFVMAYAPLVTHLLHIRIRHDSAETFTTASCVAFAALVLVARRPLPWSNTDVWNWLMRQISAFCKGFSGQH